MIKLVGVGCGLFFIPDSWSTEESALFDNISPTQQFLTIDVAAVISQVTGFDFSARLVNRSEAAELARLIRRHLLRFAPAAQIAAITSHFEEERFALVWLTSSRACQRLLRLEAFVRRGEFRISRSGTWLELNGIA